MANSDSLDLTNQIKDETENFDRTRDKGIVNPKTGSSIGMRDNGDITLCSNNNLQYKMNHDNGSAVEVSTQSTTITNRKNIIMDELIINKHKMNPKLYELSDMRSYKTDDAIGNLTMTGFVLVRAWEPNLKKYVLIRRQIRIPMFSSLLNMPDAPAGLSLDTDIAEEFKQFQEAGEDGNE